jgi:hypothetical protein
MSDLQENGPQDDNIRDLLGPLFQRPDVPTRLEKRVERSLVGAGLLHRRRAARDWRTPLMLALAAGIACFAVGLGLGFARYRPNPPATTPGTPRFVLLLYDAPTSRPSVDDVEEHRQWAVRLAREGHSITGEELARAQTLLRPDPAEITPPTLSDAALQGFFILSAGSEAEALTIARSSPHFRHGGWVVVRRIIKT